jgi:hypothetical protein
LIVFDLRCAPQGHVFEAWFGSSDDYASQQERGLVSCPLCGSAEIAKAPMAPAVGAKGNQASGPTSRDMAPRDMASADPESVKQMLAAAAAMQKKMLEGSEAVGDRFADEARAIHLGDAPGRQIHGRATREQAESLAEDGIPVAPLPFPIADPGTRN